MLTLEMIRNINVEDREFWLNKCTVKELGRLIKDWRDIKVKRELGYNCNVPNSKPSCIQFIKKILDYEDQERINEHFENIKKESKPEVAEQLTKGDNIADIELKDFYYGLVRNYHEEDKNLREMNNPWKRIFEEDEDTARRYYKGLIRYFHPDTSEYADTEMFNIIKGEYKYYKEEYEYYKNLDNGLDEDIDFSDIEVVVNTDEGSDDDFDFEKMAREDLKRWGY